MSDPIYEGMFHGITKEALASLASAGTSVLSGIGRLGIGAVKYAPGTTMGAAFALPTAVAAGKEMTRAFGKPYKIPSIRTNLNKPTFPQGKPGKMYGGF